MKKKMKKRTPKGKPDSEKSKKPLWILYAEIITAFVLGAYTIFNFLFIQLPIGRLELKVKEIKDTLEITRSEMYQQTMLANLIQDIIPNLELKVDEQRTALINNKELILIYLIKNNGKYTCFVDSPKIEIIQTVGETAVTMPKGSYSATNDYLGFCPPHSPATFPIVIKFRQPPSPGSHYILTATFPTFTHKKIVEVAKKLVKNPVSSLEGILTENDIDYLSKFDFSYSYRLSMIYRIKQQ